MVSQWRTPPLGMPFRTVNNLVGTLSGLARTTRNLTNSAASNASGGPFYVSGVTVTATPETAKLNTVANIISSCVNQVSATSANNCATLFNNAVSAGGDPHRAARHYVSDCKRHPAGCALHVP